MSSDEKPKWYSIQEAAAYLEIGEPTLYRWMKEGKITYRKVGDSTRFWKEDLDSVMEVFHSRKDAEQVKEYCPYCGGGELAVGKYRSTGLCYFQPDKTKFWSLHDSTIEVTAKMCVRCGGISLFGNREKLMELRNPEEPSPPTPAKS